MLCDAAAEDTPRPPCPSQCGRCGKGSTMINDGQVVATFARRVYRMEGCAGHTYFVVSLQVPESCAFLKQI